MQKHIYSNDVDLNLLFDNLHINVEQIGYGVFNSPISRHRHGYNYYEAHFICGGRGTLIIDNIEYPLEKGTICMTGPNITHEQLTDKNNPMEEYCFGFYVKRKRNSSDTPAASILINTHFWIGKDDGSIESLFIALSSESQKRLIGFQNNMKNYISCIIVNLVRAYTDNAKSQDSYYPVPDNKRTIITDNIFLYKYATITRKELARLLYLSERQLQRFLLKEYGKSFSALKKEARLNKATELLKQGKSLDETALIVGYADARSLNKLLKQAPKHQSS